MASVMVTRRCLITQRRGGLLRTIVSLQRVSFERLGSGVRLGSGDSVPNVTAISPEGPLAVPVEKGIPEDSSGVVNRGLIGS